MGIAAVHDRSYHSALLSGSYFEGGIKGAAFVSTPWLTAEQKGMRSPALLHAVDIYSFIIAAAEDKLSGFKCIVLKYRLIVTGHECYSHSYLTIDFAFDMWFMSGFNVRFKIHILNKCFRYIDVLIFS